MYVCSVPMYRGFYLGVCRCADARLYIIIYGNGFMDDACGEKAVREERICRPASKFMGGGEQTWIRRNQKVRELSKNIIISTYFFFVRRCGLNRGFRCLVSPDKRLKFCFLSLFSITSILIAFGCWLKFHVGFRSSILIGEIIVRVACHCLEREQTTGERQRESGEEEGRGLSEATRSHRKAS
jgi:hypothetical protein